MTVIVLRKFRVGVPRIWDDLRRRQWHPTPVLLPGKSHGQRAWWAAVHGVTKSQTRLRDFTFIFHFHALEKERATHSSVLAWRIPGTGEPGGLPSMGSHRVRHNWSDLAAAAACCLKLLRFRGSQQGVRASQVAIEIKNLPANAGDSREVGLILELGRSPGRKKWQPTPVFLTGKFHGQRSLLG